MREEIENNFEAIFKEIKSNKSASTKTNPRTATSKTQNTQPSESQSINSIGVRASNNEKSDTQDENYSLKASETRGIKHPATLLAPKLTKPRCNYSFDSALDSETRFRRLELINIRKRI